jgi:MFS family permease
MAEILALGITHFPALAVPDAAMTNFIPAMLRNPALTEAQRRPANWPEPMRAEWGDDAGHSAAIRHRAEIVDWIRKTRKALDDFAPDFVLILGDDQYENFLEDMIPAYCVNAHPAFSYYPPENNYWGEAPGTKFHLPGVQKQGKYLASKLIAAGFDTAYSYKPLHDDMGHAFANAILFLDYDRTGFNYPILRVSLNSYGRQVICQKGGFPNFTRAAALSDDDLDPPAPTPWRLFDLGGEIARILAASPWRVAIVASSGWSHGFLTPKNDFLFPDVAADRYLYGRIISGHFRVGLGTALGLMSSGIGFSAVFGPRLLQAVTDAYGWRWSFGSASLVIVIALPLIAGWLRESRRPADNRIGAVGAECGVSVAQAIRMPVFWALAGGSLLYGTCVGGASVNLVPFLTSEGLSRADAASAVGLFGAATVTGRFLTGIIIDRSRIHAALLMAIVLVAEGLAFAALGLTGISFMLIALPVFGFAVGAQADCLAYCTVRIFGRRSYGSIFGIIGMTMLYLGPGSGAVLFSAARDVLGAYGHVFLIWAGLAAVAALLLTLVSRYPFLTPPEGKTIH